MGVLGYTAVRHFAHGASADAPDKTAAPDVASSRVAKLDMTPPPSKAANSAPVPSTSASGVRVPNASSLVIRRGDHAQPIRAELSGVKGASVRERELCRLHRHPPDQCDAARIGRHDSRPVRTELRRLDFATKVHRFDQGLSGGRAPDARSAVRRNRYDFFAIPTELREAHVAQVPQRFPGQPAGLRVPNLRGAVRGGSDNPLAIVAEPGEDDRSIMP